MRGSSTQRKGLKVEEKRKSFRFRDKGWLGYRKKDDSDFKITEIKDVSSIGFNIYAHEKLQEGEDLEIELSLPGNGKLRVPSRVVWQLAASEGRYTTGGKFGELTDEARSSLQGFVEDFAQRVSERNSFGRKLLAQEIKFWLVGEPQQEYLGKSLEISMGGIRLVTDVHLEIGVRLKGRLQLAAANVTFTGRVIWVQENDGQECCASVSFDRNMADRGKICRFVVDKDQ